MPLQPPERIAVPWPAAPPAAGGELVLRRQTLDDVAPLAEAVDRNLAHLAPFMAWARPEGATVEAQAARHAQVEQQWAQGTEFAYLLVTVPSPDDGGPGTIVGAFGLHQRSQPDVLEIGYWLDAAATGRGRATAAAGTLTRIALTLPGIRGTEIHCDPANERSASVARRLGYRLDRIDDTPAIAPAHTGRSMIWVYP